MPEEYKMPSIVDAYQMYYMMDKMDFARFTPKSKKLYFDTRTKDELIKDLDDDLLLHREGTEESKLY